MELLSQLKLALADRYRIDRELGAGGMATVYLAHDLKHDRDVALKVLHPDLAATIGIDRFLTEIRVTANLQHPNILPLFDSGSAEGQAYYVMPFIDGESLRDKLTREGQLPLNEALKIASGVASALDYAHSHGVIHRDIKPENILLQSGQPVVADFGIALAVTAAGGQRLTQTGLSLGTPQYMSPEQATGEKTLDARTDIYALGVVTYEMLAGEPPFTGPSTQAIIAKVLTERAKPVTQVRERVPLHVARAVEQAIERLPADRFRTAHEFAEALEAANGTEGVVSGVRVERRKPWLAGATVALVGLLAGALAMYVARPAEKHAAELNHRRLSFDGRSTIPEISPDGRYVAYVSGECDDGPICVGDVMVRELPVGQPQLLARGVQSLNMLRWSSDASQVAFNGTLPVGSGVFVVLRSGGAPRLVGPKAASFGFYGPGTLYTFEPNTDIVHIIDAASGATKDSVRLPGRMVSIDWSEPNAMWLSERTETSTHLVLSTAQGKLADTAVAVDVNFPRWRITNHSVMYYVGEGSEMFLAERDVVHGHFSNGERVLQRGIPPLNETVSSARNGSIAIGRVPSNDNLWTFDLSAPGNKPTRIGLAPESYFTSPHLSADGRRVIYATFDLQGLNCYASAMDGSETNALTHVETPMSEIPEGISRDGSHAFNRSTRNGHTMLSMVDIATGRQRMLDSTEFGITLLAQVADGSIVFATRGKLFKADTTTGKLTTIAQIEGGVRRASPDGKRVVIYGNDAVEAPLSIVDVATGKVTKIATLPRPLGLVIGWGTDGFLYLPKQTDTGFEIWRMPDTGGTPVKFATLPIRCWPSGMDIAVEAKRAACYATDMFPDIWLLDPLH